MKNKLIAFIAVLLIVAQILLVLLSWLLSAMMNEGVRSLISGEGVRWFLGQFVSMMQTPLLVWMLLLAMAIECVRQAVGGAESVGRKRRIWAAGMALSVSLFCVTVVGLLAVMPHAVLLSATGQLFPSPFSRSLIPLLALTTILSATAYGLVIRSFHSFTDIIRALVGGLEALAPWLLVYLLAMQCYETVRYVFL